jgi:hypothetical protein
MNVMAEFARLNGAEQSHHAGVFQTDVLARIEAVLPASMERTAETGCGKSTILFSNLSKHHTVFAFDDRACDGSSVSYFETHPLTRPEVIYPVFGPTQVTLPKHAHAGEYDCVLIDGPHGLPFPELEYYQFYPHLRRGGFLVLDDVHIPTIGRLADFIQEDVMFELVELVQNTAVFRRTNAETFDPLADGWVLQRFNIRRTPADFPYHLEGGMMVPFAERVAWVKPAPPPEPPPVAGFGRRLGRALRMLRTGR